MSNQKVQLETSMKNCFLLKFLNQTKAFKNKIKIKNYFKKMLNKIIKYNIIYI